MFSGRKGKDGGGRTGKYQESRYTSVFTKLDVCIEPVTDHYRSFRVKVVPVTDALEEHFKNNMY